MNKLISILIPVYNREAYIEACIQSALDQTYPHIEIIVVDNASTDNTWAICQTLAAKYPQLKIFQNKKNIGPVRNWKRCVEEASGSYSKILFSDDLLMPSCLAEMIPLLIDPSIGFVYCAALIGTDINHGNLHYSNKTPLITPAQFLNLMIQGKAPVSPGAVLIRTNDLKTNLNTTFPTATPRRFEHHGAGPDVMTLLLTSCHYAKIATLASPLVFFRSHPDSITIANINNEVSDSYQSAIAWFIKRTYGVYLWRSYVISQWQLESKRLKKWINPISYFKHYEGDGSLFEVLASLRYIYKPLSAELTEL